MKKLSILLILASILLPVISTPAFADGMLIEPSPYSDGWDYSNETNQTAYINYEDGLEKMILSIGIEESENKEMVWLFPIPAEPDKVVIDVITDLPYLVGSEISQSAVSNINNAKAVLFLTQLYTIPIIEMFTTIGAEAGMGMEEGLTTGVGAVKGIEPDVVVYEHIEKEGMTSEIITAKTAEGLYNYLKDKKLNISEESIPVLDNYIGQSYSFIASWITPQKILITPVDKTVDTTTLVSPSDFNSSSNQKGIFVTFPTEDIYFPLLPTSVYGSEVVPATIEVIGHVSPKIFQDIKTYTETDYYIGSYFAPNQEDFVEFYKGPARNLKYTKISINAPSKFFTDDLWISTNAPLKTYYSSFVAQHETVTALLLLLIISLITGFISSLIVFKKIKTGFIGLANCVSLIGVVAATAIVKTREGMVLAETLVSQLKEKGYLWKRKLSAVLFWIDIPLLILSAICVYYIIDTLSHEYGRIHFFRHEEIWMSITIILITLAISIFMLFARRIREEDRSLFEQLKSSQHSSWSFHPKDKRKFIFIPVFSVSFLILSWLAVKLVEITV